MISVLKMSIFDQVCLVLEDWIISILFSQGEKQWTENFINFPMLFRQVDLQNSHPLSLFMLLKVFSFIYKLLKLEVISKVLYSAEPVAYEKGLVQLLRHCCDSLNIILGGAGGGAGVWAKWWISVAFRICSSDNC